MKFIAVFLLVAVLAQNSLQEEEDALIPFPKCHGENEQAQPGCAPCCPEQEVSCQNKVPRACPSPICPYSCELKCYCTEGYLRDNVSGKCVKNC
ncbi:venom peptide SjAPI-like isoform X2 [Diabrotica virgifera virgifera]|uniref:Uncharacterized protein n=1 Tax=Diabrotica virgifera virgifera TaxID=50390 RepID=A0ABM5KIT1_DIAVI|nr:venom peptide SjAPI-like isoform X2 [Diabrotica virgifera virgifera]